MSILDLEYTIDSLSMNRQAFKKKGNKSGSTPNRSSGNIMGMKIIPSDEPPVLTGQPWNSIIIDTDMEITANSFTSYTTDKLWESLTNQAGFHGQNLTFEVRIDSIQVWAYEKHFDTSNVAYERFCFCPLNFLSGTGIEMTRIESNSVRNKFAKAGYKYPVTISTVPFTLSSDIKVALFSMSASVASKAIIHIRLLWRGANAGFKINVTTNQYRYVPFAKSKHKVSESDCGETDILSADDFEIMDTSVKAMDLKAFSKRIPGNARLVPLDDKEHEYLQRVEGKDEPRPSDKSEVEVPQKKI